MEKYQHHFLDSCAIIGKLLDFDTQYTHAEKYFKKNHNKHTSDRVIDEITNRLNEIRREIISFLDWIKTQSFEGLSTDGKIISFLNRYNPFDREKNNKMLNSFYLRYLSEIKTHLLENNLSSITNLNSCVISAIDTAQNNLIYMINCMDEPRIIPHACLPNYIVGCPKYSTVFKQINKIVEMVPDSLVLVDSYYIKEEIVKTDMGFITTDNKHILKNISQIQGLLSGLFIFDMRSVT